MVRSFFLILASFAIATPAFAAGDTGTFYWQVANFALLVVVLFFLLRKPFGEYFSGRRSEVKSELDAAAELLDQAEKRHAEWQRKMIALDDELETIRRDSRERAQQEHDQIVADARASAERIARDATAAAEHEIRRGRALLQQEASDLAVELAGRILRDQVVDADRDRLADEFISQLERPAGAGR